MLESMIVELNEGEALPSLSHKGWERVGSDGHAPFNLCDKVAKRMKAGEELVASSFPEIYSNYFSFQAALNLGMEDAVRQWRGMAALALMQDEYPFEMQTLPLRRDERAGRRRGKASFTEIGQAYAPPGEDFFLPADPARGDLSPAGMHVGYFDGAPRFIFSRNLLIFPAATREDPKGAQVVPWFNYVMGVFRDPSQTSMSILQRDVLISRLTGVMSMIAVPNSPLFGNKLVARLTEEFIADLRREEIGCIHQMRASDQMRNLWLLITRGYFLGTYYADLGISVQMGDRANTLEHARREVALLREVMAVAGLPESIRRICPKGVYLYYNGRSIAFLSDEWFWVPVGGVSDPALVSLNMSVDYQLDPAQRQYTYNCDMINKMLGMLSQAPTLDVECLNLIEKARMPAVSNLKIPDTLVDLDAPPPVELPLPAPFAGVVNPVNALPFERRDDLIAGSIYKFSRSVLSDFNLTDNIDKNIIKNVNFSAIRNESGEVVDHAVPPIGQALQRLELKGEAHIEDVRMTARDYGDITVDIVVESRAPGFAGRRYIIRKSMPETKVIASEDMALSDLVIWPNVRLPKWRRYYTYFKQNNSMSSKNLLEMVAMDAEEEQDAVKIVQQVATSGGLAENVWQVASTGFFPRIVCFKVTLPAGRLTVGCFFADDGRFAGPPVVMAKTASIGLDFGTSNTIGAMEIDGQYRTVQLEDAIYLGKHLIRDTETETNMLREFICDAQLKTFGGISTALEVTDGNAFGQMTEEGVQRTRILIDGHICHSTRDFSERDAIVTGLKWGDGRGLTPTHKAAMRLFLRQVMLQYTLIAAINQATKVNWRVTFPNTPTFDVQGFKTCIADSARWVSETTGIELGTVELFTESQAAGAFFIAAGVTALGDGFLCADVGGGSTDVSLWLGDMHKPRREFSVIIGGKNILTEAIYKGLLASCRRGDKTCPEQEFLTRAAGMHLASGDEALKSIAQKDLSRVNMLREMAARQSGSADALPEAFSLIVDLMCANHSQELMEQFRMGGAACPSVYESIRFNFASIIYLIAENARRFTQATGRALNGGGMMRLFFAGNGGRLYKWLTAEDQALVRRVFDAVYGTRTAPDAVQMCANPKTEVAMGVHKLDAALARNDAQSGRSGFTTNPFHVGSNPFGMGEGQEQPGNPFAMAGGLVAAQAEVLPEKAIEVPDRQARVMEFLTIYAYLTRAPWLTPYVDENGGCADSMTIIGKLNAFDETVNDEIALSECFKRVFDVWYWREGGRA
jgi:hypothetical protein